MSANFRSLGVVGYFAATAILFTACDKKSSVEPDVNASQAMKKIETAYYEGAEKIETVGGVKGLVTGADRAAIDEILRIGKEDYVRFNSRYAGAKDISGGYDVGVVPTNQSCPLSSELVKIFLDNADDHSQTSENGGWNSSWQAGGNSDFYFCKIDGRLLNSSGGKFAVLKLGNTKPSNVKSVNYLHIDCEDHNGKTKFPDIPAIGGQDAISANQNAINALPNIVDGNQNLNLYWYVFDNQGTGGFPNLSFEYGVLGNPANAISQSEFYTDDEDGGNQNAMYTIEGVQDRTVSHQNAIYATNTPYPTLLVPERYYDQTVTGIKFRGGASTSPNGGGNEGTRFFLTRVK